MSTKRTPLFKVFMPPSVMAELERTLYSGYIAEGEKTWEFTQLLAAFIGNPRTVVMQSCTIALTIAYRLAGVGPGTEVITTPLTSIATNVPILALGAVPVWSDVDRATGMVDPKSIESLITPRTKAIVVLHKDGDPARLDEILEIGRRHGIKIVEDAAHALGATNHGTKIGNHGDYVCFSFQAIKQITTGDGGALTCTNDEDYKRARRLKWFGVDKTAKGPGNPWLKDVPEWGYKADMNDILGTIGVEQMKHLPGIVATHRRNGELYSALLSGIAGVTLVPRDPKSVSSYWTYTLMVDRREALIRKLDVAGVDAALVHPRNDVWSMFERQRRVLPNVDHFSSVELSLPSGWWVTEDEVHRISNVIKEGW